MHLKKCRTNTEWAIDLKNDVVNASMHIYKCLGLKRIPFSYNARMIVWRL